MISYQIVRVVPSLVAFLKLSAHHRDVASLSLFYSYYFGKSSSKLAELVSLPHSLGWSTRYPNRLHDLYATFSDCNKDFYVNSSFPRTATLWNSLSAECFPLI